MTRGLRIAGRVAAWVLRALGATWRLRVEGPDPLDSLASPDSLEEHEPAVAAFWHRNVLIAAWHYRGRGFSAPVSRSRDGDRIASMLAALGYAPPPRGSSTRGGAAALHELVRQVQAGTTVSIQTDGPQGPPRVSKLGIVSVARLTGRPITPVCFSARPAWQFRSWDGTLLPLPFARVVCRYGDPIPVHAEADEEQEEHARQRLDQTLNEITDALDRA